MRDLANGLRCEWNRAGYPRRADAFRQLQQRNGTQDQHLLDTTTQQRLQFPLILR